MIWKNCSMLKFGLSRAMFVMLLLGTMAGSTMAATVLVDTNQILAEEVNILPTMPIDGVWSVVANSPGIDWVGLLGPFRNSTIVTEDVFGDGGGKKNSNFEWLTARSSIGHNPSAALCYTEAPFAGTTVLTVPEI